MRDGKMRYAFIAVVMIGLLAGAAVLTAQEEPAGESADRACSELE